MAMYGWASVDMLQWVKDFERSAPQDLPSRGRGLRPRVAVARSGVGHACVVHGWVLRAELEEFKELGYTWGKHSQKCVPILIYLFGFFYLLALGIGLDRYGSFHQPMKDS